MNASKYLELFGRRTALVSASGETISAHGAIISPLRYKNKMYLSGVYTDIGFNSEGHYLYIGPPVCDLTAAPEGAYILSDGVKYRMKMSEISALPGAIAGWLGSQEVLSGIRFTTEYPAERKSVPLARTIVSVGIDSVTITDTFVEKG